jgi:hypothetical protein
MTESDSTTCCGEHKPENKGKPITLACQLCIKSPTCAEAIRNARQPEPRPVEFKVEV